VADAATRKRLGIFCRHVGRAIDRFDMISDGDRILLGVSGGKDSLSMSLALKERLRWVPIRYELFAVHVEWREYPLTGEERGGLEAFFARLEIPYRRVEASAFPPSFRGKFDCYLCARNRRRILFEQARELGFAKLALGHHLDDVVETTLMNLCYQGQFSTMMPVQGFFDGKLTLIRPLYEVTEREVASLARRMELPVVEGRCPTGGEGLRRVVRSVISELSHHGKRVRQNVYRAPWHVNSQYLPASLKTKPRSE
jgi:tRNA 2-thiocytidine biosynthesis protein TtcA